MARQKQKFTPFVTEVVEIIDAASDGRGVADVDGMKVFSEWVVPGDRLRLRVFNKHKTLFEGEMVELVSPSAHRIEPKCRHFGLCGGCKWQMMDYAAQLDYKTKQVRDIFERISKVKLPEVKRALASENIYFYRNKLEFSFGMKAWVAFDERHTAETDRPVLGFHGRGSFEKILNIEECYLQKAVIADILNELRDFAIANEIPFYHQRAHIGYLRQVMFRSSLATGELMLTLVVKEDKPEYLNAIFSHLAQKFPTDISNFLYVLNPKLNTSYNDLDFQVWKGKPYITEQLGRWKYQISPTSFFQTNPAQAARLYELVRGMLVEVLVAGENKHQVVYDLYTGTGSIAIYVSDLAEKIVGIEYVESAVKDAGENCRINGISHLDFFAGDMKKILTPDFVAQHGKPDVLITDPPRAGMDRGVVEQILQVLPKHIVYVSCHPATQARDVEMLDERYEVVEMQPVDMFPHTAHVENVMLLRLRQ